MARKQINRKKLVWTRPIWIVRSTIFETVVVAVFDNRDAAADFVAKDSDLFIEESGLNNDYVIVDNED